MARGSTERSFFQYHLNGLGLCGSLWLSLAMRNIDKNLTDQKFQLYWGAEMHLLR